LPVSQESVLEVLDAQPEPVSIATLASVTGLHVDPVGPLVAGDRAVEPGRAAPYWPR
jgi:hypothetical protein